MEGQVTSTGWNTHVDTDNSGCSDSEDDAFTQNLSKVVESYKDMQPFAETYASDPELSSTHEDWEAETHANASRRWKKRKATSLRTVPRSKSPWARIARIKFAEIGDFFDKMRHDVKVERYSRSDLITESRPWSTSIETFRQDPRSSTVTIQWRGDRTAQEDQRMAKLIGTKTPVYRATYLCRGYEGWSLVPTASLRGWKGYLDEPKDVPTTLHRASVDSRGIRSVAYHRCLPPADGEDGRIIEGTKMKGVSKTHSKKGLQRYVCPVSYQIEVLADDLVTCDIWQVGTHDPIPNWWQDFHISPRIRLLVAQELRANMMISAKAMMDKITAFALRLHIPKYRAPRNLELVTSLIKSAKASAFTHRDAFKATHLWATSNAAKELVFAYTPNNRLRQWVFQCGLATEFTLDSLIGWFEHGVYLDSSWRHKNDLNLPVTLLVTWRRLGEDEGLLEDFLKSLSLDDLERRGLPGRMTPGAALISEQVDEATLSKFIKDLTLAIVKRSRKLLARRAIPRSRSASEERKIMDGARKIVEAEDWRPAFWMIDHAGAELNAIRSAKPSSVIRCCQFHVIQAISDWRTDPNTMSAPVAEEDSNSANANLNANVSDVLLPSEIKPDRVPTPTSMPAPIHGQSNATRKSLNARSKKGRTPKADIRVPERVSKDITQAFRKLQRCSSRTTLDDHIQTFLTRIKTAFNDFDTAEIEAERRPSAKSDANYLAVVDYFWSQWLTPKWMPTIMDFGLPQGAARDLINTNNLVESGFKTLDNCFLNHTQNHRMDTLCFAIHDFFDFYEMYPNGPRIGLTEQSILKQRESGRAFWEMGAVRKRRPKRGRGPSQGDGLDENRERYQVTNISHPSGFTKHYIVVLTERNSLACTCTYFERTGKECQHAFAATLLRLLGPYVEFADGLLNLDIRGDGYISPSDDETHSDEETPSGDERLGATTNKSAQFYPQEGPAVKHQQLRSIRHIIPDEQVEEVRHPTLVAPSPSHMELTELSTGTDLTATALKISPDDGISSTTTDTEFNTPASQHHVCTPQPSQASPMKLDEPDALSPGSDADPDGDGFVDVPTSLEELGGPLIPLRELDEADWPNLWFTDSNRYFKLHFHRGEANNALFNKFMFGRLHPGETQPAEVEWAYEIPGHPEPNLLQEKCGTFQDQPSFRNFLQALSVWWKHEGTEPDDLTRIRLVSKDSPSVNTLCSPLRADVDTLVLPKPASCTESNPGLNHSAGRAIPHASPKRSTAAPEPHYVHGNNPLREPSRSGTGSFKTATLDEKHDPVATTSKKDLPSNPFVDLTQDTSEDDGDGASTDVSQLPLDKVQIPNGRKRKRKSNAHVQASATRAMQPWRSLRFRTSRRAAKAHANSQFPQARGKKTISMIKTNDIMSFKVFEKALATDLSPIYRVCMNEVSSMGAFYFASTGTKRLLSPAIPWGWTTGLVTCAFDCILELSYRLFYLFEVEGRDRRTALECAWWRSLELRAGATTFTELRDCKGPYFNFVMSQNAPPLDVHNLAAEESTGPGGSGGWANVGQLFWDTMETKRAKWCMTVEKQRTCWACETSTYTTEECNILDLHNAFMLLDLPDSGRWTTQDLLNTTFEDGYALEGIRCLNCGTRNGQIPEVLRIEFNEVLCLKLSCNTSYLKERKVLEASRTLLVPMWERETATSKPTASAFGGDASIQKHFTYELVGMICYDQRNHYVVAYCEVIDDTECWFYYDGMGPLREKDPRGTKKSNRGLAIELPDDRVPFPARDNPQIMIYRRKTLGRIDWGSLPVPDQLGSSSSAYATSVGKGGVVTKKARRSAYSALNT